MTGIQVSGVVVVLPIRLVNRLRRMREYFGTDNVVRIACEALADEFDKHQREINRKRRKMEKDFARAASQLARTKSKDPFVDSQVQPTSNRGRKAAKR